MLLPILSLYIYTKTLYSSIIHSSSQISTLQRRDQAITKNRLFTTYIKNRSQRQYNRQTTISGYSRQSIAIFSLRDLVRLSSHIQLLQRGTLILENVDTLAKVIFKSLNKAFSLLSARLTYIYIITHLSIYYKK